ncbi:transposase [Roseomonas rosulenta]|uniref:transposase n=1 Tax=Roseomonas rosulenta TaxID=2748667 RepID=UPI0018DF6544|nr:transposase [Roseomonas rosulenta]
MPHPTPLTDLQFHALLPYILPRSPAGRQIGDLRTRMDAIFHVASGTGPWCALPERFGRPDTVSRYFRRLTRAGLWEKLLNAIKDLSPNHPLRQIAPLIFRACRRAVRILGLGFIALVRRLRLLQALPGPPAKVADPDLSENLRFRTPLPGADALLAASGREAADMLRRLRTLHRRAAGLRCLPRALRLGWS